MIEKGYYYHYKRDDSLGWNHHMYEVLGTGWNTEAPGFKSADPADFYETEMVVYRPLYEDSIAYQNNDRGFWLRPSKMWFEEVERDNKKTTRFVKVTDTDTIARLDEKKREMYGA
jgi:hypothetical protein